MFASHHLYTDVTSRDWTHLTSDDHHMEQYYIFLYQRCVRILLMFTDVTNSDRYNNHRSCLHLLRHSWMLLLLINLHPSSLSSSFCWKFCCRPRMHCAASNAHRSSSVLHPSSFPDATIDWCWLNTAPHLHTFLIHAHRFAVWPFAHRTAQWLCLHLALHRSNARRSTTTFRLSFDCIVVF